MHDDMMANVTMLALVQRRMLYIVRVSLSLPTPCRKPMAQEFLRKAQAPALEHLLSPTRSDAGNEHVSARCAALRRARWLARALAARVRARGNPARRRQPRGPSQRTPRAVPRAHWAPAPQLRSFAAREVLEMHRLRLQHRVRRRYVSVHGMFVSNIPTLRSTTVIAGGTAAALDAWHARPGALYVLALTLTHRVLGRATAELSSTCAVMRERHQQSRMRDAV